MISSTEPSGASCTTTPSWRRSRSSLADAPRQQLNFFYGLSPGLDIKFSASAELECIQMRFRQLRQVGVENFALLFDDLPGKMTEEDRAEFASVAAAQSYVARNIFDWLREQHPTARLLFCPTPYCDLMDRQNLGGEGYLETIGRLLPPEIDVLWTGPEIVSREIPVDSVRKISTAALRRPPVIWDNLHANDYDLRRVLLRPLLGACAGTGAACTRHPVESEQRVSSSTTCRLRTLGFYLARKDNYEPRRAFLDGVEEWFTRFQVRCGLLFRLRTSSC